MYVTIEPSVCTTGIVMYSADGVSHTVLRLGSSLSEGTLSLPPQRRRLVVMSKSDFEVSKILSMDQGNQPAVNIQFLEGELPMTKNIKTDSTEIANVHAGTLWEASNMEARTPQKFTNVSDVMFLTKMVSVPQRNERIEQQDREVAQILDALCTIQKDSSAHTEVRITSCARRCRVLAVCVCRCVSFLSAIQDEPKVCPAP